MSPRLGRPSSHHPIRHHQLADINNGNWHYITGVRNGTTGYLYIDGVLAGTGSGTAASLTAATA